jgi:hypothetical protein
MGYLVSKVSKDPGEQVLWLSITSLELPHLHLQLAYVIHGPGFIIIVIVGHSAEAASPLLMRDTTFRQILYRSCAPNSVLRDPGRDTGSVEIFTFKDFHVDQVRSLVEGVKTVFTIYLHYLPNLNSVLTEFRMLPAPSSNPHPSVLYYYEYHI